MQKEIEKYILRFLVTGLTLTTALVVTGVVTDPVNAPKLFVMGTFGFGTAGFYAYSLIKKKTVLGMFEFLLGLFLTWMTITLVTSQAPITQNIFGVYGRNTGYLTYLVFIFYSLAATYLRNCRSYSLVLKTFLAAGFLNLIYCSWVVSFGDFIGWNNPYGAILGTFGNPNFISSFLGILLSINILLIFFTNKKYLMLIIPSILINSWLLTHAGSIQGYIVAAACIWIFGFFILLKATKRNLFRATYLVSGMVLAVVGANGVMGVGPVGKYLAQSTFSLRQQYWYAAFQMAKSNPLFGVGMDSYGDWYRRARGAQALIRPGSEVVTNVAHSVPLDLLAYGGFPLLIIYFGIIITVLVSIIAVVKRGQFYNLAYISLVLIWSGYQLQSFISINQIGLGIWGWTTSGLLVGYSRHLIVVDSDEISKIKKKNINTSTRFPQLSLIGFIGLIIGSLISFPPLNADLKYASSTKTKNLERLKDSLSNSFFAPTTSYRLAESVLLLEQSKLPSEALKFARQGVIFNKNYDDAWEMLYYAPGVTQIEKKRAKENLIRLDPLNLKWKNLE